MLDWIKNISKEHPEFWKKYLSKFDKKPNRFVVISTESTGTHPHKDVLLSIGAFAVVNNCILIGDSFETIVLQYKYFHDNGLSNDLTLDSNRKKMGESEAVQSFIEYIENAILVGHRVDFDVEMINAALERLDCGRLRNEALDIEFMHQKLQDLDDKQLALDELCDFYKIPKNDTHSASVDAYKIALLFLKLKKRLGL